MPFKSSILRFLLATLIAFSPSVCLCGPKSAETVLSCSSSVSVPLVSDCCATPKSTSGSRVPHCGTGVEAGQNSPNGCDRCEGSCKCSSTPTMKADAPTTVHLSAPMAVPMAFGFVPPQADLAVIIRVVRIDSKAVPKPLLTLLRQHCALTI